VRCMGKGLKKRRHLDQSKYTGVKTWRTYFKFDQIANITTMVVLILSIVFPGPYVQVDDAAEHHGQDFVRVSEAGQNLVLHDQLR